MDSTLYNDSTENFESFTSETSVCNDKPLERMVFHQNFGLSDDCLIKAETPFYEKSFNNHQFVSTFLPEASLNKRPLSPPPLIYLPETEPKLYRPSSPPPLIHLASYELYDSSESSSVEIKNEIEIDDDPYLCCNLSNLSPNSTAVSCENASRPPSSNSSSPRLEICLPESPSADYDLKNESLDNDDHIGKDKVNETESKLGLKRQQKCSLCANHGSVVDVKGHKNHCPFRGCDCSRCAITKSRQFYMSQQQKLSRHLANLRNGNIKKIRGKKRKKTIDLEQDSSD